MLLVARIMIKSFFSPKTCPPTVPSARYPRVRLADIGATRWRSSSDATTNIFGRSYYWFNIEVTNNTSQSKAVFVELVVTLCLIGNSQEFNPDEKVEDPSLEVESLCIDSELPRKRIRKVKKMPGEMAEDGEIGSSEEDRFRIKVFNIVVDKLSQSIKTRFADQKNLYLDLACFDPRRFPELKQGLPANAFNKICDLLPNIDRGKLTEELQSFLQDWTQMSSTLKEEYSKDMDSVSEISEEAEENGKLKTCRMQEPCKVCITCVYKFIYDYNMYRLLYTELSKVYKYLLTILLTQVSCERAFSKLELIKTRLHSNLTNDNLEAFLIMQCERDKLVAIDNDMVINRLCEQSEEMKRLLAL